MAPLFWSSTLIIPLTVAFLFSFATSTWRVDTIKSLILFAGRKWVIRRRFGSQGTTFCAESTSRSCRDGR